MRCGWEPVCVDKYEASVWQIPPTNAGLIKRVQKGKASFSDFTVAGATQLAVAGAWREPGTRASTRLGPGEPLRPEAPSGVLVLSMTRPRIVIVGGGFGGLQVARQLRRADADVVVVDRHN